MARRKRREERSISFGQQIYVEDILNHSKTFDEYSSISNYTLSSICPNCGEDTHKQKCKVLCRHCGFMWDCSEL